MEENKAKKRHAPVFVADIAKGFCMGVAFIVPGFSGGSIAAILGIYEKLIGAVADIFKNFKKSILTLLPIFIGLAVGAVSMLFPLGYFVAKFPLPTVSLFVGLTLGGLPSVTDELKGARTKGAIISFVVSAVLSLALIFIPTGADVNLFDLSPLGYVLLFVIGFIGSAAIVVPGISGSMLLLIIGYYNPLVDLITKHFLMGKDFWTSAFVLACFGGGIVIGFILISQLMKYLFNKHKGATYASIVGFIVGSIPTVYVSTVKDAGLTLSTLPTSVWHWLICVLLLAVGLCLALLLVYKAKRLGKKEKMS